MNARSKVLLMLDLLRKELKNIQEFSIRKRGYEAKIKLSNGVIIYLVYNDHDQYSYTIQYSSSMFDRKRFDNFDTLWKVDSNPHHVHLRGSDDGVGSPMKGIPEADFEMLILEI